MHPAFSTRGAQRGRFVSNSVRTRAPTYILQLTVDADALSALRQLVVPICGAAFEYMRIVPCEAGQVKVWLCLRPHVLALVAEAVRRCLPAAEFGQVFNQAPQVEQ
jgi:hypothetical protein